MSDPILPESAEAITGSETSEGPVKPQPRLTRRPMTPKEHDQRRAAAKQSTGPRTAAGKARSRMNGMKHGLSGHASFFWDSMCALGEDPHEFKDLFSKLVASLRPAGAGEMLLVEDIATLAWKKARLDRSQQGLFERQLETLETEHQRRALDVGRDTADTTRAEVLRGGLRGLKDSPSKFEEMTSCLEALLAKAKVNNNDDLDVKATILMLYGEEPTLRGAEILSLFQQLEKAPAPPANGSDKAKIWRDGLQLALLGELRDVCGRYQIYLSESVHISRAQRHAALAPLGSHWSILMRMENSLHRHIERKLKLLLQMQKARLASGEQLSFTNDEGERE